MDKLLKALLPKTMLDKILIWNNAIIVPDANILLNLYKYSEATRSEFVTIIKTVREKLWLPHQVALEFLYNRSKKIHEQITDYQNHINALSAAKEAAKKELDRSLNGIKKPFRKMDLDDINNEIEIFFHGITERIKKANMDNPNYSKQDIVLEYFLELFSEVIGDPYTSEELSKIVDEGSKRYEEKVPPGYMDLESKKGLVKRYGNTVIKSEYGDLILWKQIIQKAKSDCKPVIFICDDVKEDWRENENGKKKPRRELINEFITETEQDFLLYTTETFLEDARELLSVEVKDATITEVQDLQNEAKILNMQGEFSVKKIKEGLQSNIINFKQHRKENHIREIIELEVKKYQLEEQLERLNRQTKAVNDYLLIADDSIENGKIRQINDESVLKMEILDNELIFVTDMIKQKKEEMGI